MSLKSASICGLIINHIPALPAVPGGDSCSDVSGLVFLLHGRDEQVHLVVPKRLLRIQEGEGMGHIIVWVRLAFRQRYFEDPILRHPFLDELEGSL